MDLIHEERLSKAEERGKSNSHRIEELERRQDNLDKIAGAVEALAVREENVESDVKEIKTDVKELTGKAGKRWDAIVDKVLLTVIGAILLGILAKLGF